MDKSLILSELKANKKFKFEADFARFLGITPQNLRNWHNRNTFDVNLLINLFPEVNKEWLLTGEGEMLKGTSSEDLDNETYRLIPIYNLDARGGFDSNEEVDCSEYVTDCIPFRDARCDDIATPITGNSMTPTFPAGSIVQIREIEGWREFLETGQVYVLILTDGRRLLKEIRRSEEDRTANYLCVSHNADFEPLELPKRLIRKVYLVVAMYHKTTM